MDNCDVISDLHCFWLILAKCQFCLGNTYNSHGEGVVFYNVFLLFLRCGFSYFLECIRKNFGMVLGRVLRGFGVPCASKSRPKA